MENKIESSKLLGFKFLESGQMRVLVLAQYFPLNMMRQILFANWDFGSLVSKMMSKFRSFQHKFFKLSSFECIAQCLGDCS